MLFFHFIAWLVATFGMVSAATTSSSSSTSTTSTVKPTSVWVTGTDANGVLKTTQSRFEQTQFVVETSTTAVPSGAIGLGSVSGTVGQVRSYEQVTVSAGGSFAYGAVPGGLRGSMPWVTVGTALVFVFGVAMI